MRRTPWARNATGRRSAHVRRVVGAVAITILMLVASAAATPLDDLLADLRLTPLDGQPAPQFTLPGVDGKPVSLQQFHDRVVLLYFWATW